MDGNNLTRAMQIEGIESDVIDDNDIIEIQKIVDAHIKFKKAREELRSWIWFYGPKAAVMAYRQVSNKDFYNEDLSPEESNILLNGDTDSVVELFETIRY